MNLHFKEVLLSFYTHYIFTYRTVSSTLLWPFIQERHLTNCVLVSPLSFIFTFSFLCFLVCFWNFSSVYSTLLTSFRKVSSVLFFCIFLKMSSKNKHRDFNRYLYSFLLALSSLSILQYVLYFFW